MAFYGKVGGEWQELSNFETYKSFSLVACDTDTEVKKIVEDGSGEAWTFSNHTNTVSDIVLNEDEEAFTASTDGTIRKIDQNGQEVWQFDPGTSQNFASVATGPNGYVYSGDADGILRKISADGTTEVWTFAAAGNVNGIDVDQSGYIYIAAGDVVQKVNPEGTGVWDFLGHTRPINGIRVGDDGAVYTAAFGSNGEAKKIKPNGQEEWFFDSFGSTANDVAVNETTGEVYVVAGGELRKFDDKGNQQFEYTTITGTMNTAAIDKNGLLYVGDNNNNLYKLEDTGSGFNQVFTFQGFTGSIQGNDVIITT
jgi:sugar lactone lactonase YvrE